MSKFILEEIYQTLKSSPSCISDQDIYYNVKFGYLDSEDFHDTFDFLISLKESLPIKEDIYSSSCLHSFKYKNDYIICRLLIGQGSVRQFILIEENDHIPDEIEYSRYFKNPLYLEDLNEWAHLPGDRFDEFLSKKKDYENLIKYSPELNKLTKDIADSHLLNIKNSKKVTQYDVLIEKIRSLITSQKNLHENYISVNSLERFIKESETIVNTF